MIRLIIRIFYTCETVTTIHPHPDLPTITTIMVVILNKMQSLIKKTREKLHYYPQISPPHSRGVENHY